MPERRRYTKEQLHQETARISWPELERHFARGVVIQVGAKMDLVEAATAFANDDKNQVDGWLKKGNIEKLQNQTAIIWSQGDPDLWAVVIAPWILVQERRA